MEIPADKADLQRNLVFQVGEKRHAVDSRQVLEVVRTPHVTRVPHGPEALKGIANLRGQPLPVLSLGKVLNGNDLLGPTEGKIIVYDHGGPVGLLVDDVIRLSENETVASLQALDEILDGAFRMTRRAPVERVGTAGNDADSQTSDNVVAVLSFQVEGQLYGLPLEDVREVTTFSGDMTRVSNAQEALIGLMPLRDSVLPLVSLAALMGMNALSQQQKSAHIVVVEYDGDQIGVVVDAMDMIHRLPEQSIDTVPALLQRGRGNGQIEAIGRISGANKLISILSPEKLFGHDSIAQAIGHNKGAGSMTAQSSAAGSVEQFLIFRLGEEDYGLAITSVDEVIRVPDDITRIPGAPAFVLGVINLRGKATPLIDQRSRFDTPATTQAAKTRAIIVTLGTLTAGFVVDEVSEVKAIAAADLSAAPEFSSSQTDVFDRIAPVETDGRMVLLINAKELLTRAEQDVVAAISRETTGEP